MKPRTSDFLLRILRVTRSLQRAAKLYLICSALFMLEASAQEPDITDTVVTSTLVYTFDSLPATANTIETRKIPDTAVNKFRKDGAYWYANVAPPKKKGEPVEEQTREDTGNSSSNGLVWVIMILVFVGGLIWYLASSNIRLFRKAPSAIYSAEDEQITEDIFAIDYDHETKKAIASGNYRLATRLLYLRTLRELSDNGLIEYKHEKTNSDYLRQLSGTSYYKDFFRLTRDFEYTWYGKFQLSPESFEIVQKDFSSFKQILS